MPTRREVIQGLIVSVGGASLLSRCSGVAEVAATSPANVASRFYSSREMALVARVSDLLIPRTETPGALDVNVPGFLDGLLADWAGDDTQRRHRRALAQLQGDLDQMVNGDFNNAAPDLAETALARLDSEIFSDQRELDGYRNLKSLVAQAYFASEPGALEEQGWVAVPGRWDGCVELETGN
jgi:hypothetical protein